jgi:hypothetical protein
MEIVRKGTLTDLRARRDESWVLIVFVAESQILKSGVGSGVGSGKQEEEVSFMYTGWAIKVQARGGKEITDAKTPREEGTRVSCGAIVTSCNTDVTRTVAGRVTIR